MRDEQSGVNIYLPDRSPDSSADRTNNQTSWGHRHAEVKQTNMTFCSLNIEGLWRFCDECDVVNFVKNYDFVLFTETFCDTVPNTLFSNHTVFSSPGVKISDSVHGRLSGGVAY